jgi:phosphomannomutase
MVESAKLHPEIFGAYDIRGVYPETLDEAAAYAIGRAMVQFLGAAIVAVGRDMRVSSPALSEAIMRGITDQGADAIDLGLTTTDELYFAVGKFEYVAGVMITASHNPAQYNGMKLCRADAVPLSADTGLHQIRDLALAGTFAPPERQGHVIKRDVTGAYVEHVLSFIDVSKIRPYRIAVDAGNGMAGMIVPAVFEHLPCELIPLYFDLDGTFPNHPASPIEPENTAELRDVVVRQACDMGVAFDGDADRMFLVSETGHLLGR